MLDSALGLVGRIGRYFSLVTVLPNAALILYVFFVVSATSSGPDLQFQRGWEDIVSQPWHSWLALFALAVLIGLIVHPLQYGLTQFCEGYWGPSHVAVRAATGRILSHRARAARLEQALLQSREKWLSYSHRSRPAEVRSQYRGKRNQRAREDLALERLHDPSMDFLISAYVSHQATAKVLLARYPDNHGRILPTRLGNVLRSHEDRLGTIYGLDGVAVMPLLGAVAREKDVRRFTDEGEQMDLCLRISLLAFFAALIQLFVLAAYGPWVFTALVPYAFSYLSYRAACAAAEHYMGSSQSRV